MESGEVNTVRLVNANGYYYWFVFFLAMFVVIANMGVAL